MACEEDFINCDNDSIGIEQLFRLLLAELPDGNPAVRVCDSSGGGGGGLQSLPVGKTLFVSTLGDDLTALRERLDLPFSTIDSAVSSALAGDTIVVFSGTYSAFQPLHKDGVNWEFIGTPLLNLFSLAKWSDNNIATVMNIQGDADIVSFVSNEVIDIQNSGTRATINFRNVTGRGSNVISLNGGSGVVNIEDTLKCVTVNRPINLRNDARFIINVDTVMNTAFSGIRPCVYTNSLTGYCVVNAKVLENGINNAYGVVITERIPQTGTLVINISEEIRTLNLSPYAFWKKVVFHMAGNLIINGTVNGGNTCAFSKVYGGTDISYLEHNGLAYNDGTQPLVEMNQGQSTTKFSGIYETSNVDVFKLAGSTKNTISGEIKNTNLTGVQKRGITTSSATKLILGLLKIVFDDSTVPNFGVLGTNASDIKIIHGVSANADVNPNITNLITGTNYIFDTDVE